MTESTLDKSTNTFVAVYKEACVRRQESPDHVETYQELDDIYKFIMDHPEKEKFQAALNESRLCIVIPYKLFLEKRLPPDDQIVNENGKMEDVMFASPGHDTYRSLIIDQMKVPRKHMLMWLQTVQNVNSWKMKRLEKVVNLGWDQYRQQYL